MNDFLATLDISIKPKQSFSKEIIRKVNFLMKYPGKNNIYLRGTKCRITKSLTPTIIIENSLLFYLRGF